MTTTATQADDELELPEELDGQQPLPLGDAPPPDEEQTPEQKRIAELESQLAEKAKAPPPSDPGIAELASLAKQYLASQNKPAAPTVDKAALEAWGKKLQELAISGDPAELAQFVAQAADGIATNRVNAQMQGYSGIAERAGEFTVQMFLTKKAEEVGPNGTKLHKLVAGGLALSPEEKSWLSTADTSKANDFLEQKYEQSAGRVLIKSSRNAKPRNLDAGAAGGGKGGGNALSFAGVDEREMQKQIQLAEQFWPDPVEREKKLKSIAAKLAAERNAQ